MVNTAADVLDKIRNGSQQIIVNARLRLNEAEAALGRGEFQSALSHLNEAKEMIAPLALAETHLAIADGSYLVRVREIEVGMTVLNVGVVTAVNARACPQHGEEAHVTLHIGDDEVEFSGSQLLYVERDASDHV